MLKIQDCLCAPLELPPGSKQTKHDSFWYAIGIETMVCGVQNNNCLGMWTLCVETLIENSKLKPQNPAPWQSSSSLCCALWKVAAPATLGLMAPGSGFRALDSGFRVG